MSQSWDLTITPATRDGVTILSVSGPVDVEAIGRLRYATQAAVCAGALIVDLDKAEFLDSAGIGVLYRACKDAQKAGHRMALVATGVRVLNVLRVTGLDRVAEVYGSQDEAVAAMGGTPVGDPIAQIREAAEQMRGQHGPGHPRHEFWQSLARWLDKEANCADNSGTWLPDALRPGPLAVARAYLKSGETR